MTYEEKLLAVFSRFRGAGTDAHTLEALEKACNAEVWAHLPPGIRSSWRLHLAFGKDHPGQIELCPTNIGPATPAQLEAALKEEFRENGGEEASSGIAGFSMNFSGDVNSPVPAANVAQDPAPERTPAPQKKEVPPELAAQPVVTGVVSGAASPATEAAPTSAASEIAAQAKALGISLPPNSSLLQPFLEALAVATAQKQRADAAEAKLEALGRL